MLYIPFTHTNIRDSAADLFPDEARLAVSVIRHTVEILHGHESVSTSEDQDAQHFNLTCWASNTPSLIAYGEAILEKIERLYPEILARPDKLMSRFSTLMSEAWTMADQVLTLPPWTQDETALRSMRSYMCYINASYISLWPDCYPKRTPVEGAWRGVFNV